MNRLGSIDTLFEILKLLDADEKTDSVFQKLIGDGKINNATDTRKKFGLLEIQCNCFDLACYPDHTALYRCYKAVSMIPAK